MLKMHYQKFTHGHRNTGLVVTKSEKYIYEHGPKGGDEQILSSLH